MCNVWPDELQQPSSVQDLVDAFANVNVQAAPPALSSEVPSVLPTSPTLLSPDYGNMLTQNVDPSPSTSSTSDVSALQAEKAMLRARVERAEAEVELLRVEIAKLRHDRGITGIFRG